MAAKLEANVERDPAHNGTRIVLRFRRVQRGGAEIDQQRCGGLVFAQQRATGCLAWIV